MTPQQWRTFFYQNRRAIDQAIIQSVSRSGHSDAQAKSKGKGKAEATAKEKHTPTKRAPYIARPSEDDLSFMIKFSIQYLKEHGNSQGLWTALANLVRPCHLMHSSILTNHCRTKLPLNAPINRGLISIRNTKPLLTMQHGMHPSWQMRFFCLIHQNHNQRTIKTQN